MDLEQGMERVEVMNGSVDEQSNLGSMTIEQDSVLVMQPGAPHPTTVSQGITEDDWDQWVAIARPTRKWRPSGPSPDAYTGRRRTDRLTAGTTCRNTAPGLTCQARAMVGFPMAAAGWAPYSIGQWCWYPGCGLHLDWRRTLGVAALPLWRMGIHPGNGLGLVSG